MIRVTMHLGTGDQSYRVEHMGRVVSLQGNAVLLDGKRLVHKWEARGGPWLDEHGRGWTHLDIVETEPSGSLELRQDQKEPR